MKTLKRPRALIAVVSMAALVATFSILQIGARVGATGNNITGVVRNPSNGYVSGAYVYATTPSSSTPLYGPVTTNVYGAYTLNIPVQGTYDIHIDPPSNNGWTPYVDSSVSVTSDQVINYSYSSQTNTLSGTLTDSSSNPLAGVTVKIFHVSTTYQTTTDSNGNYSIPVPAGYYYMYLSGSMTGIPNFTLTQSNTSSINLLSGSLTLNLTIHTATMTVTQHENSGATGSMGVTARATSGITSLYPGDPGTTISLVNSTGFNGTSSGTIKTIVGATYAASGLEASSYTTSVCKGIAGSSSYYDCLRLPLTVTGDVSFDVPTASPATRTFSGTLTDSTGAPIPNIRITLNKYSDSTTYADTDANGNFSISAMPKKYYLTANGHADGMSFTLAQSSTNPSIDLTTASMTQNLQVNSATLTVSADDASGNPNYGTGVSARTSSGTAYLYTGDPGETLSINSDSFTTSPGNNVGTIGTIVGAYYAAKGVHTSGSSTNVSICDDNGGGYADCLTTALTVTGAASVNVPF